MKVNEKKLAVISEPLKRSTNYSAAETSEIRTTTIKRAIGSQLDVITKSPAKTDLHDLEAVKTVTERYINRCGEAGICPNFEGLCCYLGISRVWGYEFLRKHSKEESAEYLNNIRLSMASLRMSLAEARILDNATTIFILKNSGLGFVDKAEYAITEPEPAPEDEWDAGI